MERQRSGIDFNPRSRTGSDGTYKGYKQMVKISIHAPAQGATLQILFHNSFLMISIHAPAQGATVRWRSFVTGSSDFNPRSRTGSDPELQRGETNINDFNPRSRTGSDLHHYRLYPLLIISIHAPAQGATMFGYYDNNSSLFQSTLPHRERHKSS